MGTGRRRRGARAAPRLADEYTGFKPAARGWALERVPATISCEEFWRRFVSQRKPCVLEGEFPDSERWRTRLWTTEYLRKVAGREEVDVERRTAGAVGYGQGKKQRLPFGDVVSRVGSGDENLYVTTQTLPVDDDGPTQLFGPPLTALSPDFPSRLGVVGGLAAFQVNMWYGRARDGSSSGLHHDHHDNVYCLVRGRKRFTLLPPSDAPLLRTHSKPVVIHKNGLINYHARTRADGADHLNVAQWELREAESELAGLPDDAEEEERERLEAVVEEKMDAVAEMEFRVPGGLRDDFDGDGDTSAGRFTVDEEGTTPDSFCHMSAEAVRGGAGAAAFPELASVKPAIVELKAGDKLYLPCGWFHEVTSYSDGDSHLALNFWYHPPTQADPAQPYEDSYWTARHEQLLKAVAADGERFAHAGAEPAPKREQPAAEAAAGGTAAAATPKRKRPAAVKRKRPAAAPPSAKRQRLRYFLWSKTR